MANPPSCTRRTGKAGSAPIGRCRAATGEEPWPRDAPTNLDRDRGSTLSHLALAVHHQGVQQLLLVAFRVSQARHAQQGAHCQRVGVRVELRRHMWWEAVQLRREASLRPGAVQLRQCPGQLQRWEAGLVRRKAAHGEAVHLSICCQRRNLWAGGECSVDVVGKRDSGGDAAVMR